MTLGVYSHANLNDMVAALDALPVIPSTMAAQPAQQAVNSVAPLVALTEGFDSIKGAAGGSFRASGIVKQDAGTECVSVNKDRGILRKAVGGSEKEMAETTGLEPATSGVTGRRIPFSSPIISITYVILFRPLPQMLPLNSKMC